MADCPQCKGGRKYQDWLGGVLLDPGVAIGYLQEAYDEGAEAFWQAIQDVADAKRGQ